MVAAGSEEPPHLLRSHPAPPGCLSASREAPRQATEMTEGGTQPE